MADPRKVYVCTEKSLTLYPNVTHEKFTGEHTRNTEKEIERKSREKKTNLYARIQHTSQAI